MSAQELLVQQFVAAVIRLAGRGTTDGGAALPVPSFGDVEAAVREHFKLQEVNPEALIEAIRKASGAKQPELLDRALSNLQAAHAQELLAGQQTAFLIGMEVGRASGRSTK
jgi:hypothetical protein